MVEAKSDQAAQFYDHLKQNMADGILVLDEAGIVTSANQAAADLLGYAPDTLVGRASAEFWPAELPAVPEAGLQQSAHVGINIRQRDGCQIPVNITITPVSDHIASSTMIAFSNADSVEHINRALTYTQRLAGIGLLTTSVAHELNTPMSIIAATCSNLLHEVDANNDDPEQLRKYVEMIEQNAWRAARVVEVLRNYSYEEEAQMAVTDLNMIVEDALTLVRHQFNGEHNIEIETDLSQRLGTIVCDHNRITQVLLNLLSNARDAMVDRDSGKICIRSWLITPQTGILTQVNGNGAAGGRQEQYAFSISDTGAGIPRDLQERMFEPFFTTKANGTGLGLFIADQIVRQHNGHIWAEKNEAGGATFTVMLPHKRL